MGFYDIDIAKVIRHHTPVRLRKTMRLAWLGVLLYGVQRLYDLFMIFRSDRLYRLTHNSQVCYMEAVLNDLFDSVDRRIYIDDGVFIDPEWLYLTTEERPIWLAVDAADVGTVYDSPTYLYTTDETIDRAPMFVVKYPLGLLFDEAKMRALIDRYRLPSRRVYTIESYV